MRHDPESLAMRRRILTAQCALQRVQIAAHVQELRSGMGWSIAAAVPALVLAIVARGKAGRIARFAAIALVVLRFAKRWMRRENRGQTSLSAGDESSLTPGK